MISELLREMETDSFERLKWLVMHEFAVLPGSRAARRLRPGDVLFCASNMLLDMHRDESNGIENPDFDQKRFKMLGGVSGEKKV